MWSLAGIILGLMVLVKIFEPKIKGYIGETEVKNSLAGLPESKYKVLNNIMLRTEYGTTQIDHIVVSVYGIFVVETKNYRGWITGSEFSEQWTKNMYGKRYTFRNPLKQNYAHVKALESKLNIANDKFIPIVAFSRDADIKVKTSRSVVYINQLQKVIQGYNQTIFNESELSSLVYKIQSEDVTTNETTKEHIKDIKSKVNNNNLKIKRNICPKCGGSLVKREGKYGEFLGCSNFPKCRYIYSVSKR